MFTLIRKKNYTKNRSELFQYFSSDIEKNCQDGSFSRVGQVTAFFFFFKEVTVCISKRNVIFKWILVN